MKAKRIASFITVSAAALLFVSAALLSQAVKAKIQAVSGTIYQFRGPEWEKYLNKTVTLKGFYYNGSIPMVIDDFDLVLMDMKIPKEAYVPLVGPVPAGLKSGAEISVTGRLIRPAAADPVWMRKETLILKIEKSDQIRIISKRKTAFQPQFKKGQQLSTQGMLAPRRLDLPFQYAVLISGGIDEANSHIRYWNDLKTMYALLRSMGYWKENIFVIYADGKAKDDGMPVNFSASKAGVRKVFDDLARKMTDNDTLYIMLNDHGAGFLSRKIGARGPGFYGGFIDGNSDEDDIFDETAWNMDMNGDGDKKDRVGVDEALCLWGEDMTDDEFATEVNKIGHYSEIIVQMKQCFGGGFVRDLTGPRRTIMSSCSENDFSYGHKKVVDDEVIVDYGEFTYWYFAALAGKKPDDAKSAVDADKDKDGFISVLEAYEFARIHDVASETPFLEDDGVTPGHNGKMPANGDGNRAAKIILTKVKQ
jgi:hypothetical protein